MLFRNIIEIHSNIEKKISTSFQRCSAQFNLFFESFTMEEANIDQIINHKMIYCVLSGNSIILDP